MTIKNANGREMDPHLEKKPEAVKAFLKFNLPQRGIVIAREKFGDRATPTWRRL